MNAPFLGSSALARGTLVLGIACLYAGAVLVNNNLLFPWLEFENFRSLLFLPAGLKLFLVMLLGWRAVLGIALGIWAVAVSEFPHMSMLHGGLLGAVAALSTQVALQTCARLLRVGYPWTALARIFHRSRATNEYGIALVCPKIQVSNLDQRAGNAEAKLYRRN